MDTCHFREAAEERLLSTMFPVERRRATLISWGETQTEKEDLASKNLIQWLPNLCWPCRRPLLHPGETSGKGTSPLSVISRNSRLSETSSRILHLEEVKVDGLKVRMGFVARLKRSATWLFLAQDWCRRQGWSRWDIYGILWDVPRSGAKWMWARWYRQTV